MPFFFSNIKSLIKRTGGIQFPSFPCLCSFYRNHQSNAKDPSVCMSTYAYVRTPINLLRGLLWYLGKLSVRLTSSLCTDFMHHFAHKRNRPSVVDIAVNKVTTGSQGNTNRGNPEQFPTFIIKNLRQLSEQILKFSTSQCISLWLSLSSTDTLENFKLNWVNKLDYKVASYSSIKFCYIEHFIIFSNYFALYCTGIQFKKDLQQLLSFLVLLSNYRQSTATTLLNMNDFIYYSEKLNE